MSEEDGQHLRGMFLQFLLFHYYYHFIINKPIFTPRPAGQKGYWYHNCRPYVSAITFGRIIMSLGRIDRYDTDEPYLKFDKFDKF